MKYLFFMIAFITMAANLLITVQAVKLKSKIHRVEDSGKQDVVTFYLPPNKQKTLTPISPKQCEDTVLLDLEV